METFLIVVVLACLVMIIILYFELRAAQGRMEEMRGDVEARIRSGLSDMAVPVGRIPVLEQRIQDIERDVAVLQPVIAADTAAADAAPPPATP
jgi:predicted Holliday junction resolvase-like endonuclease